MVRSGSAGGGDAVAVAPLTTEGDGALLVVLATPEAELPVVAGGGAHAAGPRAARGSPPTGHAAQMARAFASRTRREASRSPAGGKKRSSRPRHAANSGQSCWIQRDRTAGPGWRTTESKGTAPPGAGRRGVGSSAWR